VNHGTAKSRCLGGDFIGFRTVLKGA